MLSSPSSSFKPNIIIVSTLFMILKERCIPDETELCKNSQFAKQTARDTSSSGSSLRSLILDGYFSFEDNHHAARDFGNRYHLIPLAVLYPKSVSDVSTVIKHVYELGPASEITVAARGHGHSIQGQSQAHQGIVINMESFGGTAMQVHSGEEEEMIFVDVSGGELWINILHETLKHGLAPKSWTDYLHLSVGGTLSNGGISGQAFRHGPQINNVCQLEVVTGKGEILTCTEKQNSELFYGVLGGLGQFGIISRARISLEPAPKMVKWIRALYSKFSTFSEDQETLIMSKNYSFDFIEGFVIKNRENLVDSWRPTFSPKHPQVANQFNSDGKTFYCLEMAKYFNSNEYENMIKDVENQLSELSYIPSMLFFTEVSYMDFLDRVHASEKELRAKGLWEVPHPWLNLLIPKSKIHYFADEVFGRIISDTSIGPILIYPINKTKWNNKTSLVTPPEDMFYLVGFLSSALLSVRDSLEHILSQNKRILEFCNMGVPGFKQYLPHYITRDEWADHFGPQWQVFEQRKFIYDPLAILAPGQRIFQKAIPFLGGHVRQAVIERQA